MLTASQTNVFFFCCFFPFLSFFLSSSVQGILICPELWHLYRRQVYCDRLWWQEGHCIWSHLLEQAALARSTLVLRNTRPPPPSTFPQTDRMDVACSPGVDGQEVWQCQTEADVGALWPVDAATFSFIQQRLVQPVQFPKALRRK